MTAGPRFLVDHREPPALRDALVALGATPAQLACGDVHVGAWAVERKTVGDFVQSMLDGRLFDQAARLRDSGLRPLLVLEGPLRREPEEGGLSDRLLRACHGALASLAGTHAIPVVPTSDLDGTIEFLASLRRRRADALVEVDEVVVKLRRRDPYLAMLAQVPGIGAKRAADIAARYPSFAALEPLRFYDMVDEFGPKTAATLWRLLKGRDVPDVYRRMGTGVRARRLVDANPALEDAPPSPAGRDRPEPPWFAREEPSEGPEGSSGMAP